MSVIGDDRRFPEENLPAGLSLAMAGVATAGGTSSVTPMPVPSSWARSDSV
jgi:hypothetical protein